MQVYGGTWPGGSTVKRVTVFGVINESGDGVVLTVIGGGVFTYPGRRELADGLRRMGQPGALVDVRECSDGSAFGVVFSGPA